MVVEQPHKLLSGVFETLPRDDPNRKLIQEAFSRDKWRASSNEVLTVAEARQKLERMIKEKVAENKTMITQKVVERNMRTKEVLGKDSIADLLPTDFISFSDLIHSLLMQGINTKSDLAKTPDNQLLRGGHIGEVRFPFVRAMRDLAIAEAVTKSNPQQI